MPGTDYFDGDDTTYTGWITSMKNQYDCNSCACFASVGMIEAIANLYFNQQIDYELAEQQLVSCAGPNICAVGVMQPGPQLLEYAKTTGLVTEHKYPYQNSTGTCQYSLITTSDTLVKSNSWNTINAGGSTNFDDIKNIIINKGPFLITLPSFQGFSSHSMLVVGYRYTTDINGNGHMIIICKNSWGSNLPYSDGMVQLEVNPGSVYGNYLDSPVITQTTNQPIIICQDLDGDGYYNWGIGPKPASCTSTLPEDCDDSNPGLGPSKPDYSCTCLLNYSMDTLYLDGTNFWDSEIAINKPVVIRNGASLKITKTIYFHYNSTLIVRPGGSLIIDGGKLTKACNEFWNGVQVWGKSNKPQNILYQGKLTIINGGTIEFAKTGVLAGKKTIPANQYDPAYNGGIIQATNGLFRNNMIDVEFRPYSMPSTTNSFKNTIFETNNSKYYNFIPTTHVLLENIKSVSFYGCDFKNELDEYNIPNYEERGNGITSYDSRVIVNGLCTNPNSNNPCNSYDSCKFENLRYGIRYINSGTDSASISIQKTHFDLNVSGIYLSGTLNSTIKSCVFNSACSGAKSAIYLDGCTGYTIEGNIFYGDYPKGYLISGLNEIGIYVKNSGTPDNQIYNNSFQMLHAGVMTEGINKGPLSGLCIKCNDFFNNNNDICVYGLAAGEGIKSSQGSDTTASKYLAGNTFTYNNPINKAHIENNTPYDWNYLNTADHFNYYHHQKQIVPIVTYPLDSNYTSNTITRKEFTLLPFDKSIACPPHTPSNIAEMNNQLAYSILQGNNYLQQLNTLTDGGNTDGLAGDIAYSTPSEALELRDDLLGKSPYLSDTVLLSAIDKENVLPGAMLRDVLVENPHSAKNETILEAIDERSEAMPEYMMADIMDGKKIIGEKERKESLLGYWQQEAARLSYEIAMEYLKDTIGVSLNSNLLTLYSQLNTLDGAYRIALLYVAQGNFTQSIAKLAEIGNNYKLGAKQLKAHNDLGSYINILQNMQNNDITPEDIDSSTVVTLKQIMQNNDPVVSDFARGLLMKGKHIIYTETIATPQNLKTARVYNKEKPISLQDNPSYLKIFPNPADNFVIIEYRLEEKSDNDIIEIIDAVGNLIKRIALTDKINQMTLPLDNFATGTYLVTLLADGKKIETRKLAIVR